MKRIIQTLVLLSLCMAEALGGNINVHPYFQSGMILQRGKPVTIWGNADPGTEFNVTLGKKTLPVVCGSDGTWQVTFRKMKATFSPLILKVAGQTFTDILVGDVWICSGQSNMVFRNESADEETRDFSGQEKTLGKMRLLLFNGVRHMAKEGYTREELERCNTTDFYQYEWTPATEETLKPFSAVATRFGMRIIEEENVPVGLLCCAVGGSAINNWIPEKVLRNHELTRTWFHTDWLSNKSITQEHQNRCLKCMKSVIPADGRWIIDETPYHFLCEPSFLFESSFAQISKAAFKGVLWYQGEADAKLTEDIARYGTFYRLMVESWRENFNDSELPFISIQLPSYNSRHWPLMREMQYNAAAGIPGCFLVPAIDQGEKNQIHYKGKKTIGRRAADMALSKVYGKKTVMFPSMEDCTLTDGKLCISFNGANKGLHVSGKVPAELEVLYEDGTSAVVTANLNSRNQLEAEVGDKAVSTIRYAWKPYVRDMPLLFNSDNIPVYPFQKEF